ncbi:MAG TPA: hypothetical protein VGM50_08945 [Gemmatimonadaceae bacterium]
MGLEPLTHSIEVAVGAAVDRAYEMVPIPVQLAAVNVNDATTSHASPRLQEFLERKKTSSGGHFITDDVLRKNDARKLLDIGVSEVPGVRRYQPFPKTVPSMEYLSSAANDPSAFPNLNRIATSNIAGIESYPGSASAYHVDGKSERHDRVRRVIRSKHRRR